MTKRVLLSASLVALALSLSPTISNAQTSTTPKHIDTSVTNASGKTCNYALYGSWRVPNLQYVSAYWRRIIPNPDPGPPQQPPCHIHLFVKSYSDPAYTGTITADSYIAYRPTSDPNAPMSTFAVDNTYLNDPDPGHFSLRYKTHEEKDSFYFSTGPHYKIRTNSIVEATTPIW
jgi:hypothetical protein